MRPRLDYYARGENAGGQVVMPSGQAFADGENITAVFEKEMFPQGGWEDFGLAVFALCTDGSEILLDDYWPVERPNGRYIPLCAEGKRIFT